MDRDQQIRVAAVAALAIVLAIVLYTQVIRGPSIPGAGGAGGGAGGAATLTVPELTESDVDVARLMDNIKDVDFIYEDANPGRDPMTSLSVLRRATIGGDGEMLPSVLSPAELLLYAERIEITAIAGSDAKRVATVTLLTHDYVVQAGHRFDVGILVKRITENSVVFAVPGKDDEDIELTKDLPDMPSQ